MSGQILPSFFTKGATEEDLKDSAKRYEITMEIADFIENSSSFDVD